MDVWSTGRGVGEASEGVGVRGEVGQAGGLVHGQQVSLRGFEGVVAGSDVEGFADGGGFGAVGFGDGGGGEAGESELLAGAGPLGGGDRVAPVVFDELGGDAGRRVGQVGADEAGDEGFAGLNGCGGGSAVAGEESVAAVLSGYLDLVRWLGGLGAQ